MSEAETEVEGLDAIARLQAKMNALQERTGAVALAFIYPHRASVMLELPSDDRGACERIHSDHVSPDVFAALESAERKYDAQVETRKAEHLKKMAVAIIRLTYELGECTNAALRIEFSPRLVDELGADACALADTMSDRKPFTITRLAGANAEAA